MENEIEETVQIGRQNQEMIALGKAWCTHIRTDRGDWGVGMVEEMTKLPVVGGRFTCDFARHPGFGGMQLAATALGFYRDNCKGCPHRAPGNRIPNLSTWAEPLLDEYAEQERAAVAALEAELEERQKRAEFRLLVAASLPAASQEIVALMNRIDLDPSDTDAQETFRDLARLAPDVFAQDIKEMLYTDTRMLNSAVLLDALLSVDMPGGSQLHELCLNATREGWGRVEGCRYLSEHGLRADLDEDLLNAIVFHAAPGGHRMSRTPGEPAALLHYHSVSPDEVEDRVMALLRHGNAARRVAAAAASHTLLRADPACGGRLLRALLDGLRYEEGRYDEEPSAGKIAEVVSTIFRHAPRAVDAAIEKRWSRASHRYRSRLINCYDSGSRDGSQHLVADEASIVIARAVAALSEHPDLSADTRSDDYQILATCLLRKAVRACPTEALQQDVLIGLLLSWLNRDPPEPDPTDPLAPLQQLATQARIKHVVRDIADAVVALGQRDAPAFMVVCSEIFSGAATIPSVRTEVVRIASRVAAASSAVNDALPLIYTAMLGDDQSVRAAGMEAAKTAMQAIPHESIPPLLAQAVVAGLSDPYTIVVMSATSAAREVPADLINHRGAAARLLRIARSYAGEELRDRTVQDALTARPQPRPRRRTMAHPHTSSSTGGRTTHATAQRPRDPHSARMARAARQLD